MSEAVTISDVRAKRCDLIKIGITNNVQIRLQVLRTASPDKLTLMGVIPTTDTPPDLTEKAVMHRFWQYRHHGEWFQNQPPLRAFIAEHAITELQWRRRQAEMIVARAAA